MPDMRWPTLVHFFGEMARQDEVFLVFDDGYRRRARTYVEVAEAARTFAADLVAAGVVRREPVVFWSENRPEWIVAFWGTVLAGAVIVPVDFRASADFCLRIVETTRARLVLTGEDVVWPRQTPARPGGTLPLSGAGPTAWRLASIEWGVSRQPPRPPEAAADDLAEIVFTSGATGEPRGVLISHRNLLSTLEPIDAEIRKYRRVGRPFFPLRFLDLLPLSHLFGQSLSTFIPPLLPGTTVFARGHSPSEVIRLVRAERVSVLVAVPRLLELIRSHLIDADPATAGAAGRREHVAWRWWRYRRIHRMFGAKFWCVIVGAAPLDDALERFWSGLGFLVIQGYGLTETAPIVSLNHPFAARGGSVGKPIPGVEVRLAADGEILVRGPNVTRGYLGAPAETADLFEGEWLRTGDLGEMDADGRLFIRGRRKEMIVTPDGLNVFPEDVERVLNAGAGVTESAVVGVAVEGAEQVHAVLVIEPGADADAIVREANRQLAGHQRIRGFTVWRGAALPRTEGTAKLKRGEIRRSVAARESAGALGDGTGAGVTAGRPDPIAAEVSRLAGHQPVSDATGLDELGLGSLDRVELMAAMEQRHGIAMDESSLLAARTVADLRALAAGQGHGQGSEPVPFPTWSRAWPVRACRRICQALLVVPLTRVVARATVNGLEHVAPLSAPVVYAANHQSHLDTPVILAALPPRLRRRLAAAMAREFFAPFFHPEGRTRGERWRAGLLYYLAVSIFHGFPLPQREAGTRATLRHVGALVDAGWSILIFPEGRRSADGRIGPFLAGVGLLASGLGVPVVPVRLEGIHQVLPAGARRIRPGRVSVSFGRPVRHEDESHAEFALRIERAVRDLGGQVGTMFDNTWQPPV